VWDIVAGGKLRHTQSNHQKTITTVTHDPVHNRLITGALDHMVKIYELPSFNVVHSFQFASPVLSATVSVDGDILGVGQTDRLTLRARPKTEETEKETNNRHKNINRGSMPYFLKSLSEPVETLVVKNTKKHAKLANYEKSLRKFQYGNAMDEALRGGNLDIVMSVLRELVQRDGLRIALSGRDEEALGPIVDFIGKYLDNPLHTPFLLSVLDDILDIYGPVIESGSLVARQLRNLRQRLSEEIKTQQSFLPLLGALEFLVNASIATIPIQASESPSTPI